MTDADADAAVLARGLAKRFDGVVAVDGIDFRVPRGVCFGFLGPNGAGKTTTMRMIYRALPVDGGHLAVLGLPVGRGENDRAIKAKIGVVPQDDPLDQDLTLRQILEVFARFYGLRGAALRARTSELLDFVGLEARADSPVRALSGGMRRRGLVARGLVGDPELVILDEPTTGLDPDARHALWERLHGLKRRGSTLLLTTHYMEEAERLCDRLVFIDQGRIVAEGSPRELIDRHLPPEAVEVRVDPAERAAAIAGLRAEAGKSRLLGERLLLYAKDGEALVRAVAHALPGERLLARPTSLEDVFLEVTGHGLEAAAKGEDP